MPIDILLPQSFCQAHSLYLFQLVIVNNKYPCTIGLSSSECFEIPDRSTTRLKILPTDYIQIQLPKNVIPIRSCKLNLISPIDHDVLFLVKASLIYRLHGWHLIIGTEERVNILGNEITFVCVEVITPDGTVHSFNQKITDLKIESDSSSSLSDSKNVQLNSNCMFTKAQSTTAFKFGLSSQISLCLDNTQKIVFTKLNCSFDLQLCKQKYVQLEGLKKTENIVLNYLRNLAIVSQSHSLTLSHGFEPGIVMYGLPGCGKRTFLDQLANKLYPIMEKEPCFGNLKFLFINSKLLKELKVSRSQTQSRIYSWLMNQIGTLTYPLLVVFLWPNLDKYLGSLKSDAGDTGIFSNSEEDGEEHESESDSNFINFIHFLLTSVEQINLKYPLYKFSILASATLIDKVFQLYECRQLFYRRLLVPLPNAFERYQLLRTNIMQCFDQHNKDIIDSDQQTANCLYVIASQLHGYVPKDLIRLVQVSHAAYLSSSNDTCSSFDLEYFCQILKRESSTYLPINLSQHLTLFEPLHWNDIGGYAELKLVLKTMIQDRLFSAVNPDGDNAKADAALGLRVPRGILLHGPPGCSKTMFVRALATECNLPLIAVQASRIFGRYVGDSERNMRRILVQARASAPAVLFIDEIDLLLPSRSSKETGASEHVLGEILTAMDGVEGQTGQIILVAATNRLDKLDSALSRAGRFDLVLEVPPPNAVDRSIILCLALESRVVEDPQSHHWSTFAQTQLVNYTGAEIVQLVQQAAELARQEGSKTIGLEHLVQSKSRCMARSVENYDVQRGRRLKSRWKLEWFAAALIVVGLAVLLNFLRLFLLF